MLHVNTAYSFINVISLCHLLEKRNARKSLSLLACGQCLVVNLPLDRGVTYPLLHFQIYPLPRVCVFKLLLFAFTTPGKYNHL